MASKKMRGLQDIPARYARKGSQALVYRNELLRMLYSLSKTNQNVQYSAQVCTFSIKSINTKSGFIPDRDETFRQVEQFAYHYENYCYRVYAFRDKLLKFFNAILKIHLPEGSINISDFLRQPSIVSSTLNTEIKKFDSNAKLSEIIKDRNSLTHKVYYDVEFNDAFQPIQQNAPSSPVDFKKWCSEWSKLIESRAALTNDVLHLLLKMNSTVAGKIVNYRK